MDDQEFTTWSRSHGGNKNTHYDSNDFINRDNIKNLKLQWVFESIKDDNLKKWKQHIEVNPIFLNNKLIVVSADWKIFCLNPVNGDIIWEKQTLHAPSRRGILAEHDLIKILFIYISP